MPRCQSGSSRTDSSDSCFTRRSVGKAYIAQTKGELLKELEQTAENSAKDAGNLEQLRDKLQASLKEAEKELAEYQKTLAA